MAGNSYKPFSKARLNARHPKSNRITEKRSIKYHGIWYNKQFKMWRAGVRHGRIYRNFGLFLTEKDAARAYNEGVLKFNLDLPLNEGLE